MDLCNTHHGLYLSKSITDPTNKYLQHLRRIVVESFIVKVCLHDATKLMRHATWDVRQNRTM